MPPITYRLMVHYIEANRYQLFLRLNEDNLNVFLGENTSYANLKTRAGAIFKATLTWNDATMQTQDFADLATGV